jgi:hypothetical protein
MNHTNTTTMNHTHINEAAARRARHLQHIVTPARTGGEIGRNRRRNSANMTGTLLAIAGIAAAIGLAAATLLH